ncbi:MBOAT family O-acyltransferase [bacterium]
MIFHSADYIIFLLVCLVVYWALPRRGQNIFLLLASYFFYGYIHPWFIFLILFTTIIDFYCGKAMEAVPERKKVFLVISVAKSLLMLCIFKYFGFFTDNIIALLGLAGYTGITNTINIILPVGISFYTFQTMSYTIDIYRGTLKARTSFIDYALFVAFFPQLVAGPIERAANLLPQFEKDRKFDPDAVREALYLILWGFFKKLVIADNVGITCNKIFMLEDPSFLMFWTGVFAFHVQIFADFSAYTDIARGCARLLGINIIPNFNHPYIATSPADFWRRWHQSLSSWIRDYIYIPLGGSRVRETRIHFNLMVTFILCGMWHGANWNYVVWGAYYGVLMCLVRVLQKIIPKKVRRNKPAIILRVVAMFFLTQIAWVIFREQDFHYIIKYLSISPFGMSEFDVQAAVYVFLRVFIFSLPIWIHIVYAHVRDRVFGQRPWLFIVFKTLIATLMFIGILTLHSTNTVDFIYFQF